MSQYDLLVVGGGPAGAATAYWAAKAGMSVLVLEKKKFPRDKTCGDGLTPRAVRQLDDMGVLDSLEHSHRNVGLRTRAAKRVLELEWPEHPDYPNYGLSVRRCELDQCVLESARAQGAEIRFETEALSPILSPILSDSPADSASVASSPYSGKILGALIKTKDGRDEIQDEIRAKYTIIADGSNSRFGRALGTARKREWPQGMAIRTYYESPQHKDEWLESDLDIRNKDGETLPGYGWIFPLGDGTINVGVGILSTFKNYKEINTSHLMKDWAEAVHPSWDIDPDNPCMSPLGGRLPMGGSVNPKAGENWMVVGDAAGCINPFNGEGIDYAYETGRKAAEILTSSRLSPSDYSRWIDDTYGLYFQVARAFAKVIGRPAIISNLINVGMRSETLMEWALRIMANLLRPNERGPAELAYYSISRIIKAGSKIKGGSKITSRTDASRL